MALALHVKGPDGTEEVYTKQLSDYTNDAGFVTANDVAAAPNFYKRKALPSVTKTEVTVSPTWVNINNIGHISTANTTLDINSASSWDAATYATPANRAGKSFYIYACAGNTNKTPRFILSANSTTPTGYNANTSRKIGGFHCLCADVGTIADHDLSGYQTGDILPLSVWDLCHRPIADPEGMVWIEGIGKWVDIYLAHWSGSKFVSQYNGTHNMNFSGEKNAELMGKSGKHLCWRNEFMVFAKGSNECTNIVDSTFVSTTGGHVDTEGRRMISNYGIEDCCGLSAQWGSDLFESWIGNGSLKWMNNEDPSTETYEENNMHLYLTGYQWRPESVFNPDENQNFGQASGLLRRVLLGGGDASGVRCGSRYAACSYFSSYRSGHIGARGVSEPRPFAV